MPDAPAPTVFLSYSWSSAEYADRIERLAQQLTADGIHVLLDQWDLREGQDKNQFMERSVTDPAVTRVLILLDPRYAERADQREGGVGTETLIISPQVYRQADQQKFIPVVMERNPDGSVPVPTYLTDRIYIDLSDPESEGEHYERLVRNIFGKPERVRPPIGKPPSYLQEDAPKLRTGRSLTVFKDAVHRGRTNPLGYLEDYFDRLVLALEEERIQGDDPETELDERVVQSIERFLPYRNEYLELIQFLGRHVPEPAAYERLHRLFERFLEVRHQTPSGRYSWELQSENLAWISWEMFLYTIAILLRAERFDAVPALLKPYYVESGYSGRGGLRDFGTIDSGFRVIDDLRKSRLRSNYYSLTAKMLRERSGETQVPFESLMAADLALWFRAATHGARWYPRTLYYGETADVPSLFVRAGSRSFFERLAPALGVTDRDDLLERFGRLPQDSFYKAGEFWGGREAYARLLNVELMATRG